MKGPERRKAGFACDGDRFIYLTYGPEEFFRLWGGTPDDYRDFLVAWQEELAWERDDLCLFWPVRVPFDLEDYLAWVEEDPSRALCADAHREWAVWVARRPERLAAIRSRHPFEHFVPREEILKAETLVWCLPVTVPEPAVARRLLAPLPLKLLQDIRRSLFTGVWHHAPPFERLSARRARGLAVIPGDRLVVAARARRLLPAVERFTARVGKETPEYFAVAARHCILPPSGRLYPWTEILGLPILLLGGAEDVDTGMARAYAADVDELPVERWESFFAAHGINFHRAMGDGFVIALMAGGLAATIKEQLTQTPPGSSRRHSHLKRVK